MVAVIKLYKLVPGWDCRTELASEIVWQCRTKWHYGLAWGRLALELQSWWSNFEWPAWSLQHLLLHRKQTPQEPGELPECLAAPNPPHRNTKHWSAQNTSKSALLDAHTITQSHAHIIKRENLKDRVIRPVLEFELWVRTYDSHKNGHDYVAIVDVKLYLSSPTVVHWIIFM